VEGLLLGADEKAAGEISVDVFLSDVNGAGDFKGQLVRDIESHGISVWFAPRDMPVGVDWNSGITQGIQSAHIFLPVLSADKAENPPQIFEIKTALSFNKTIILILPQKDAVTPPLLFHYRYIDFANALGYKHNLDNLVQEIKDSLPNG
jgi:hypothetical protein